MVSTRLNLTQQEDLSDIVKKKENEKRAAHLPEKKERFSRFTYLAGSAAIAALLGWIGHESLIMNDNLAADALVLTATTSIVYMVGRYQENDLATKIGCLLTTAGAYGTSTILTLNDQLRTYILDQATTQTTNLLIPLQEYTTALLNSFS